jgi:two-component system response regulator FixJ
MRKLSRHLMIYIVDDDGAIRDSLALLLSCEGLASRCFATAAQFLESEAPTDDDFLISDVQMPGMSGLDLLLAIRKRGLGLPVVLMTGRASPQLRERALDGGAAALLDKPLKDTEILSLIRLRGKPPP